MCGCSVDDNAIFGAGWLLFLFSDPGAQNTSHPNEHSNRAVSVCIWERAWASSQHTAYRTYTYRELCEWYSKRPKWNRIAALCGEKSNSNNNAIARSSKETRTHHHHQQQKQQQQHSQRPELFAYITHTEQSIHNLIVAKHFGFIWAKMCSGHGKICERTFPLLLYCAMALSRFNCMWWASRVVRNYMYISFALLLPSTQCLFSVFGVYCVCSFFGFAVLSFSKWRAHSKAQLSTEQHTAKAAPAPKTNGKKGIRYSTQILSNFCCVSGT